MYGLSTRQFHALQTCIQQRKIQKQGTDHVKPAVESTQQRSTNWKTQCLCLALRTSLARELCFTDWPLSTGRQRPPGPLPVRGDREHGAAARRWHRLPRPARAVRRVGRDGRPRAVRPAQEGAAARRHRQLPAGVSQVRKSVLFSHRSFDKSIEEATSIIRSEGKPNQSKRKKVWISSDKTGTLHNATS